MPRYQDPKEADRIMREAGAIPLEPYLGSQVKWKCSCMKCKEIIYPTFALIKNAGVSPCRTCAANEMAKAAAENKKKTSITCVKGKTTKKVTAINPKCPKGYKKK